MHPEESTQENIKILLIHRIRFFYLKHRLSADLKVRQPCQIEWFVVHFDGKCNQLQEAHTFTRIRGVVDYLLPARQIVHATLHVGLSRNEIQIVNLQLLSIGYHISQIIPDFPKRKKLYSFSAEPTGIHIVARRTL